ncbi:mitochondrial 37S ribosomal protein mS33 RSM27 [Sporobolomyces salmoneus]|uniref:mitochondrial 37S ribosomal protein mS33 RSM27 n=1 Tax=Sporobolomyces salmoneus TaxID=183962 RepID=UPI00317A3B00
MLPTLRRLAQQAVPSAERLQQVVKLRSEIFQTTYNPQSLRTGSKILKARLRGPAMLRYYGERFTGWKGLEQAIPGLQLRDIHEETRLADLEAMRKRGKVKPKKGQGRRASMKKR